MKDWTGVILLLILFSLSSIFMGYWPWANKKPLGQPWLHLLFSHQLHEKLNLQRCEKEKKMLGTAALGSTRGRREQTGGDVTGLGRRKVSSPVLKREKSFLMSAKTEKNMFGFLCKEKRNNKIHLYHSYKFSQLFYTCTSLSHTSAQGRLHSCVG